MRSRLAPWKEPGLGNQGMGSNPGSPTWQLCDWASHLTSLCLSDICKMGMKTVSLPWNSLITLHLPQRLEECSAHSKRLTSTNIIIIIIIDLKKKVWPVRTTHSGQDHAQGPGECLKVRRRGPERLCAGTVVQRVACSGRSHLAGAQAHTGRSPSAAGTSPAAAVRGWSWCRCCGGGCSRSAATVGSADTSGSCSGRHRWVIYTTEMNGKNTFWDVDGSMVPPEWHRWLHCMTDDPPTTKPPTPRKFIWKNHKFNVSATPEQYVPYSTTRKKIQEWVPPSTPYK
uniref:NADH dehydrogenase [ubiquinone] 1 alpha subcomplex subunit 12 n=1 Tax=Ornithorhynchus anatinus TaxID=9258 RepID=A0A6I8NL40_ORNAN